MASKTTNGTTSGTNPGTTMAPSAARVTTAADVAGVASVEMARIVAMRLTHAEEQEDAHVRGEHDAVADEREDARVDAEAAEAAEEPTGADDATQGDSAPVAGSEGDGRDAASTLPSVEDSTAANGAKQEPETEREKRARERVLKAADSKVTKAAAKIVGAFERRDQDEREWFPRMGRQVAEYLRDAVDLGVGRKTALAKLKTQALVTLGGSIEQDVTRAMQLAGAWTFFGDDFLTLPTRAQKSLASCFELGGEVGKDGKETGHKVYTLAKLSDDDAAAVFTWVMGGDIESCPVNNATYTKSGCLAGPDADQLIQQVKGKAAAGPKTDDGKPATGAAAAVADGPKVQGQGSAAKATVAAAAATKPAKTERVEVLRLPVKPVIAAAELVKALMAHDDKVAVFTALGHCKELTTMLMDAMFVGMGEAGRVDDMIDMSAALEREVTIADYVGQQGGPEKCSRADAVAALRTKNPGMFTTTAAA